MRGVCLVPQLRTVTDRPHAGYLRWHGASGGVSAIPGGWAMTPRLKLFGNPVEPGDDQGVDLARCRFDHGLPHSFRTASLLWNAPQARKSSPFHEMRPPAIGR